MAKTSDLTFLKEPKSTAKSWKSTEVNESELLQNIFIGYKKIPSQHPQKSLVY